MTAAASAPERLVDLFESGLDAPICLTWELTYACNLACVHCLSSSGRRDPRELTTSECRALIDELQRLQVFYVNIGGGEPTVRSDFWELVDYATDHQVGVKFSTNGSRITSDVAERLAAGDYVDVQVSIDGAETAQVNDAIRGEGSYATALRCDKGATRRGRLRASNCGWWYTPQRGPAGRVRSSGGSVTRRRRLTRLRPRGVARTSGMRFTPPRRSSARSTTGW